MAWWGSSPTWSISGLVSTTLALAAHPGALLGRAVAVVGGGHQAGHLERGQRAELVLGEGLGGEEQQRGGRAQPGGRRPRRSGPGSRATCPRRCRWRRRPTGRRAGGRWPRPGASRSRRRRAGRGTTSGSGVASSAWRAARAGRRSTCTSRGSSTSDERKPSRPGSAGRATVRWYAGGTTNHTRVRFRGSAGRGAAGARTPRRYPRQAPTRWPSRRIPHVVRARRDHGRRRRRRVHGHR